MKNTEKLTNLLNKLEKYNVYLYDNFFSTKTKHRIGTVKTQFMICIIAQVIQKLQFLEIGRIS